MLHYVTKKASTGFAAIQRTHTFRRALSSVSSGGSNRKGSVEKRDVTPMDGNGCAAHIAYAMSDNAFIYPISPATSMGEYVDLWASEGRKNVFGAVPEVFQMQSEGGAAGALHGTISAGALSSTFTASQGLLLMIPNMYMIAGELQPAVFHVSARALARQALSIFNDHSDVMAVRQTGWAMLCSHNVQEVADLALVAHLATLKSSIPFLHFFDGQRTSAEIHKIELPQYDDFKPLVPMDMVQRHRSRGLNPNHPTARGTGMRGDTYMQASVAANPHYFAAPALVDEAMREVESLYGRKYRLFDYHGSPEAEEVIVVMCSASGPASEMADYLNQHGGRKVGVLKPRLFRPWSAKHFLDALPESVTKICVLDRTKEDGSMGLPLYQDVLTTIVEAGQAGRRQVVGGSFGLASKEFTPTMAKAVFDMLKHKQPRNHFVVGINDDVTHTSISVDTEEINCVPANTKQATIWGTGGDGTIGANKEAIKIISNHTELCAQGFFAYDSKKQGGVTMSHLRFGPSPILSSSYLVSHANYVAVHNPSYIGKFDVLANAVSGAKVLINCPWTLQDMETRFPKQLKQEIVRKKVELYTIDAADIAHRVGMGKRINMIMQASYFRLSGVLPEQEAMKVLSASIERLYGRRGDKVVAMNKLAVQRSMAELKRVEYPPCWGTTQEAARRALKDHGPSFEKANLQTKDFVQSIMDPMLALKGDTLPVSAFMPGNQTVVGTSKYERRVLAKEAPKWLEQKCTQCNYCAIACPHAAIRPFLFDKAEVAEKPASQVTIRSKSLDTAGLQYAIQVAPFGCTGCGVCVAACPDNALVMQELDPRIEEMDKSWEFSVGLPSKAEGLDKFSVRNSQFQQPLLEFSGACAGCGETPYVKLATQLFGDRMLIANSSGCSSVWGGTFGEVPYTTNRQGKGPAWGRSLFEDTAEYGLGMKLATARLRSELHAAIVAVLEAKQKQQASQGGNDAANGGNSVDAEIVTKLTALLKVWGNPEACKVLSSQLVPVLQEASQNDELLRKILQLKDYIVEPSQWIIGGDGWAYDIGYGGLDHVLASGKNVNVLVLDTEMYSNTGGQVSKSTPKGSYAKYAMTGKKMNKKDLGMLAMSYGHVYVASVCLSANFNQTVQAMREAENYNGPSLILAYAPCVDWGHSKGSKAMVQIQKDAVDSGYWPLYRFDPRQETKLRFDSTKIKLELQRYLNAENRFAYLQRSDPVGTKKLTDELAIFTSRRYETLNMAGMDQGELFDLLKVKMGQTVGDKVTILYASETGNAEDFATSLAMEMKHRQVRVTCKPMNDFSLDELSSCKTVFFVASTCGQGEWPANSKDLWKQLSDPNLAPDALKNVNFAVFGLGDSSYVFFCETAKLLDKRLTELSGTRLFDSAFADEHGTGGIEGAWEEWKPKVYENVECAPASEELPPQSHAVKVVTSLTAEDKKLDIASYYLPPLAKLVPLVRSKLLTPVEYDRDIRHYEFDLSGLGMSYGMGDSLGIWPRNKKEDVEKALEYLGLFRDDVVQLEDMMGKRKHPLPSNLHASVLFEQILDLFGRPKRRFYEMMASLAKNEKEKALLKHLLSAEGRHELDKLTTKETVNHLDILRQFPETRPNLAQLLDYVPDIRPRLYSIASSSRLHGEDALHLLIVADDWVTASGVKKQGLCTSYLRSLDPSKLHPVLVTARVNPAAVLYPEDLRVPMVLSGLGTGLAPLRAALEERVAASRAGEEVGPVALFFGSRHEKEEFPYGDEFKEYKEMGVLTELHCAWSRDQDHKIYIQDRMKEQQELLYDYLVTRHGNFYYCGTGGRAVSMIQKAVESSFVNVGGMSPEQANKAITDMRIAGRYNVESW
eukprot:gb/GEZN01000190.1/.p1 GENE.gb/GEZN01000190.1/~~gb/GEZN01000190.1/.p1  ORF type:complete len:1838 (+),score=259.55 gb/GEZN01000190.1/:109-5622(+)